LYKLLDRLESVVMDGIPIPFLPYSMINQEKLIMLLDKIQTAIPDEVQQADQVLSQKEEIQLESQRHAQQMLQEAKQQAEIMLSESELLKAVQIEAERIRQQVMAELQSIRQQTLDEAEEVRRKAYEEARFVRESADEYAETVLKTLSRNLDEFQSVAKNAQKHLKKARADAMQAQHSQSAITSGGFSTAKPKEHARQNRPARVLENQEISV
jgi:hypothetical protein